MGATDYMNVVEGTDVRTAYNEIVEQEGYESGYSYSGTISQSDGYDVVTYTPMTVSQAEALAYKEMEDYMEKSGPARAIPVVKHTPATYNDSVEVDVEFKVSLEEYNSYGPEKNLAALKAAKVKSNAAVYTMRTHSAVLTETTKVTTTEGGKVTKFFAIPIGSEKMPKWESGHPSQAAARAAIADLPKTFRGEVLNYEVFSMTRRESGAGFVESKTTVKHVTVNATVTYATVKTPAKDGTEQWGWMFYGLASS